MAGEWEYRRLEDICECVVDCPHSTPLWTDHGRIVLRSKNIRKGKLDLSDTSYTTEAHYQERRKRADLRPGDIVITREAPMGEVCIIPSGLECCLGQRMVMLRPDARQVNAKYLLYALQSKTVQHAIHLHDGTGSTVSNFPIPAIRNLLIPVPDIETQEYIAKVLGDLDDKIELNRKMNVTLESMARALFKSWFVDFDPVRAKMEGRQPEGMDAETAALFPERLVQSELGMIPEGWEVREVGKLARNILKGVDPTSLPAETPYVGLEHIDRRCHTLSRWGVAAEVESQKLLFKSGDFLFGKLRPYFHKVCRVNFIGICSTDVLVIRPCQEEDAGYVGYQIFEPEFVEYANLRSTGTRMPRASWKDMAQYEVACPPRKLREAFNGLIRPIREMCDGSVITNQNLDELQNALLSGLVFSDLRPKNSKSLAQDYLA